MVKFGERLLNGLMYPGWEHAYLDYEMLKRIIDGIQKETAQTDSERFLTSFTSEMSKVDTFISERLDGIRTKLTPSSSGDTLRKIEEEINHLVSRQPLTAHTTQHTTPLFEFYPVLLLTLCASVISSGQT